MFSVPFPIRILSGVLNDALTISNVDQSGIHTFPLIACYIINLKILNFPNYLMIRMEFAVYLVIT